jgi:hypothetical protein
MELSDSLIITDIHFKNSASRSIIFKGLYLNPTTYNNEPVFIKVYLANDIGLKYETNVYNHILNSQQRISQLDFDFFNVRKNLIMAPIIVKENYSYIELEKCLSDDFDRVFFKENMLYLYFNKKHIIEEEKIHFLTNIQVGVSITYDYKDKSVNEFFFLIEDLLFKYFIIRLKN